MGRRWDRWFLAFPLAVASCAAAGARPAADVDRLVRQTLDAQVAAWNRGSVEGFMEGYSHSPNTTFLSGTRLSRGFDAMLARYLASYPAGKMGTLEFNDLEIRTAGDGALAVAIGRYRLTGDAIQSGAFTLVLQREGSVYRILHDHTSAEPARAESRD